MLGTPSSSKALLVAAVVLAAGLAGCAGAGDGGSPVSYDSYEDAKQAPGTVWEANNTDSPIVLKMLKPSGESTSTGEHDVVFLLYDREADEPVTNAEFEPQDSYDTKCGPSHAFCASMPEMGHGTSPEESPQHVDYGVYKGMTTFTMPGDWRINVNPLVDGEVLEYDVPLTAQGEGGSHSMDG